MIFSDNYHVENDHDHGHDHHHDAAMYIYDAVYEIDRVAWFLVKMILLLDEYCMHVMHVASL